MIMSPAQLDKLGASFAHEPGLRRPVQVLENRVAGDSITVVKSPYYYDKKNVHLDKIVFKVENDAAAAAAALKAGDLQALDGIDSTQLQGIKSDSSLRIVKQTSLGYQGITLNIGNKNGLGKLPYTNVGTPLASKRRPAEGVRGGDRPQGDEQGRLRRHRRCPGCTPISPASAWYDPSDQVHAATTRATRRSSSRRRRLEPDRAPDGADRHRSRSARRSSSRPRRRRSASTSSSTRPTS